MAAITSSDPISNTTPVGLVTIPDADTVLDSAHEEASRSIAAVLQPRKRDGTEMAEAGATGVAACNPTPSDQGAHLLNEEMDLDETQAAALDRSCKRRKEDDVTREMIEGAAPKAVDKVMSQSQSQQQLLIDSMNGSVEKAVSNAVGGLT